MSTKNNVLTKQLNARKIKLEVAIEQLSRDCQEAQRDLSKAQNQLVNIKKELETYKNREPQVTEHAILRYIERILKIDTNAIQKEILNDAIRNKIITYGSGKYPILEGHHIVVKGVDIVSIV